MEHQMNGKDQAALTACIPQSLAGGIFIYKADEGETLLYASDYVIGFLAALLTKNWPTTSITASAVWSTCGTGNW